MRRYTFTIIECVCCVTIIPGEECVVTHSIKLCKRHPQLRNTKIKEITHTHNKRRGPEEKVNKRHTTIIYI